MTQINSKSLSIHENELQEAFKELRKAEENFLQKLKLPIIDFDNPLFTLAEYGWYVNMDINVMDLVKAIEFINLGKIDEMDEYMKSLFESRTKNIFQKAINLFPTRKHPILEAQKTFELAFYYSTIPLLFCQIDGIAEDIAKRKFFLNTKINGKFTPEISEWAKSLPDSRRLVAGSLLGKGAFQLHHSQPNKINFTRHSILHGETNDYGTKSNTLKVISLLGYLCDIAKPRKTQN